ncbi:putative transcriptional regulator (AraC/XylS family protein) [Marinomonas sp. MED121]|nr:putative transcriptional regulator (AraC/XylS family protein) [Marinomonas sp. MED121]
MFWTCFKTSYACFSLAIALTVQTFVVSVQTEPLCKMELMVICLKIIKRWRGELMAVLAAKSVLKETDSKVNRARSNQLKMVENRIGFAGLESELSIYDTYESANRVGLDSDGITLCGMLTGKKVVHCDDVAFDFLPQQSFVMSPNQHIDIDFPLAKEQAPTTCLTINLSQARIQQISDQLNFKNKPMMEIGEWRYRDSDHLHMDLSQPTQSLLERLVALYSENSDERDLMIELGISELTVRMLQQQARNFLLKQLDYDPELTGLHKALQHIENYLDLPLDTEQLQKLACMSRSKFFQRFKQQLGCTPGEYQMQRRIEVSANKLKQGMSVTQASIESGFQNVSHFSRRFYLRYGKSPTEFKRLNTLAEC